MTKNNKKARNVVRSTNKQLKMLIDYMATHTHFANGDFKGPQARRQQDEQWEELKALLNEHGPHKSILQWQKSWCDLRRKARTEVRAAKKGQMKTAKAMDISDLSEDSIKIIEETNLRTYNTSDCGPPSDHRADLESDLVIAIIENGETALVGHANGVEPCLLCGGKMAKGNETIGKVSKKQGKIVNFDHLVFWVANAKTASSYFVTRFGFKPLAVREPTAGKPVLAHAVRLNKITIVFECSTNPGSDISSGVSSHGDFVKDVAFEVQDLEKLVEGAREGGAEIVKEVTEEEDEFGTLRYAVLKTYGANTHTLIDRSKYTGVLMPGFRAVDEDDECNKILPKTNLEYIDHVEGNMVDGTLEDSVSWYQRNLNMQRFWCVDYSHDITPYSSINSASVTNPSETVLLSMNEAAPGLLPSSKASDFVKAHDGAGVEHVALYTDDIVTTMRNLKARGAEILTWPSTYYDLIRKKLEGSALKMTETIEQLQENNILIDFDSRGYMLQAFTKHLQPKPTLFIEILQRRNHRGFGAMNYKWVFEAIELLDSETIKSEDQTMPTAEHTLVIEAEGDSSDVDSLQS